MFNWDNMAGNIFQQFLTKEPYYRLWAYFHHIPHPYKISRKLHSWWDDGHVDEHSPTHLNEDGRDDDGQGGGHKDPSWWDDGLVDHHDQGEADGSPQTPVGHDELLLHITHMTLGVIYRDCLTRNKRILHLHMTKSDLKGLSHEK